MSNESKTSPSPAPWRAIFATRSFDILDHQEHRVACGLGEADAKHICLCVNSHSNLVMALQVWIVLHRNAKCLRVAYHAACSVLDETEAANLTLEKV